MDELLTYLNTIRPLSLPLSDRIERIFTLRRFRTNSFLLREGDILDQNWFVVSGLVRCFFVQKDADISRCFLQKDDLLLTDLAFPEGQRSPAYLQALHDSTVLSCSRHEFNRLYHDYPEFEHHGRILIMRCLVRTYAVLDGIRMHSAKERYLFLEQNFPELLQSVPHKYLASYISLHEITLSKIRSNR